MLSDLLHMRGDLDGEIEATKAFINAGGAPDLVQVKSLIFGRSLELEGEVLSK